MAELWPGGPITLPHRFTHDGVDLTVPELPVADLLYWLSLGQWWRLYPNALGDVATEPLWKKMFDPQDPFDLIHLHDVATTLFGRLAGIIPTQGSGWYPAMRLANVALTRWSLFHAWCIGKGILAPLEGTLMAVIGAAYAWLRDGLGPDQLARIEQDLWATPPQAAAPRAAPEELPEHIRQEEASAFLAALGEQFPGEKSMAGKVF